MVRYRETFRRHRALFTLPVIVAVVFAAWFGFGATPAPYRSTATVWIDNGPANGSFLRTLAFDGNSSSIEGPADAEQALLKEQLVTPNFDLAVASASDLPRFLASAGRRGFSPTVLMSRNHESALDQAAGSVATEITSLVDGPNVLHLTYTGPTPAAARSVLASLIAHMTAGPAYASDLARQEEGFFQQSAATAQQAAANAKTSAAVYKRQHPAATGRTDPIYAQLVAAIRTANTAYASATAAAHTVNQAASGLGVKPIFRVVDPPSTPASPTISPRNRAFGLLGGLVAGLLVSLLGVFVATPSRQQRWDDELSTGRWMRVRWHSGGVSSSHHPARMSGHGTSRGAA
jgi:hypothetical protein